MSGRHVLALTNDERAAAIVEEWARQDFPLSTQVAILGHEKWIEVSVDADEYNALMADP